MKTHTLTGLKSLEESREALQKRIRLRAYQLYQQRKREGLTGVRGAGDLCQICRLPSTIGVL